MTLAQDRSMDYICRNLLAGGEKTQIAALLLQFGTNWARRFLAKSTMRRSAFSRSILSIPIGDYLLQCYHKASS